jgi:hypothetical protein
MGSFIGFAVRGPAEYGSVGDILVEIKISSKIQLFKG